MSAVTAMVLAVWLGIQTSISPCPLATNIAAVSFIARDLSRGRRVLLSGGLYALGRCLAYMAVAFVLLSLLVGPLAGGGGLARGLQRWGPIFVGPILILAGVLLLDLLEVRVSMGVGGMGLQQRVARGGPWWALPLGALFALSFCPVSAGLFFFGLIPLSVSRESQMLLPALFGVGTAAPVLGFAIALAFAGQAVGRAFDRLTEVERWVRVATGLIFISVGIYFTFRYVYEVPMPL